MACRTTASVEVPLATDFELAPGRQVTVAGTHLIISLVSVQNDSRCPVNVACVWAGSADVRLHLSGAGVDSTIMLRPISDQATVRTGSQVIELRRIAPKPEGARIDPAAYRVTLRVTTP